MVLQDSMNYNVGLSDVCGWVAPDGREYALVGLYTGVSIVNINVTPIKEIAFVPWVDNFWRDINTFGHYAYVTTEANAGLMIINLEFLPDSVQYHTWSGLCPTMNGPQPFGNAHTLNIDENGIAFLNGSYLNGGGCILIDVHTNPEEPVWLGYAPAIYSHDCIARDSILYSAEIYDGTASIYDYHDIQNITLLGSVRTPQEATHNIALSADGKYMFTTDEIENSYTTAYDISDPGNIRETDRFRQAAVEGSGAVVHNAFMWEDWLVLAYYTSGTLIVDASRPDNLVEVGNFDSFPGIYGTYDGVWGAYPWLPSGKILASDRTYGLFVFIPNYVRAAFLEGTVIDSITRAPLFHATVSIESDEIILPQLTPLDGTFKTGKAIPGVFPVTISRPNYHPKTIELNFINGEVLTPLVELRPIIAFAFYGKVIYPGGKGVPHAKVSLSGKDGIFQTEANVYGNFFMPRVYQDTYEAEAGIWGQTVQTQIQVDSPMNMTFIVQKGYDDDFDLDLGWSISGNASEGTWMRGVPTGQKLFSTWQCGSPTDSPFDPGQKLYSTGLSETHDAYYDEVSHGTTILTSPSMDLDSIFLPHLSFDYWLCEFPPNEYLGFTVWMTNGEDTTLIHEFRNDTTVGSWQRYSEDLQITGPRNNVQIIFKASDTTSHGDYWLKVHVDNFSLTEGATGLNDNLSTTKHFLIYPNPVKGSTFYLKPENGIEGNELTLKISDVEGRVISSFHISKKESETGINHSLENGMYFLQWATDKGETGIEKILVLEN